VSRLAVLELDRPKTGHATACTPDCDACVEACPVDACFAEDQLPDEWQKFTELNAAYFKKTA
jgi:ferredoxin